MSLSVAVAGATGVVGQEVLSLLTERGFPVGALRLMASPRSAGREIVWQDKTWVVEDLEEATFADIDVAFFCAGSAQASHARRAAAEGALVIDNSSAFRGNPDVPLVVPQVNGAALDSMRTEEERPGAGLVANPNCSTILLVMVVAPLCALATPRRLVISTYQAVSGSGAAGLRELDTQRAAARKGEALACDTYPMPIHANAIPFVQAFREDGTTTEERKMLDETRRILSLPDLAISTTCVRVPVERAHAESVNIEFDAPVSPEAARAALEAAPGVRVIDAPEEMSFPTPRDAEGQDEVLVGRIRLDPCQPATLDLWLTGDQIRKGAALNAIEIAEYLLRNP